MDADSAPALTPRRFLVREGPHGWERWNNFTGDWWLLPFGVETATQAVRAAADIYCVPRNKVTVEGAGFSGQAVRRGGREDGAVTRATEVPLRRIVRGAERHGKRQEYVVELTADELRLRPLRVRKGGPCDVAVKWGAIYTRILMGQPKLRRKPVSRGLLS